MEKPIISKAPEKTVEPSLGTLAAIKGQMDVIMEPGGLYAPLWLRYKEKGADDPVGETMKKVETFYNNLVTLQLSLAGKGELSDGDKEKIKAVSDNLPKLEQALAQAETLVVKSDEKKSEGASDALAILRSMKTKYSEEEWTKAVKTMRAALQKGWVVGDKEVIAKIGGLISEYVKMWDSLGTDGLKGVEMKKLREMEGLRIKIVSLVADSGDIHLQVLCSEGSEFYKYIGALAAQTCSSRDVQIFEGWWKKNSKSS
ncbi:MAG: hypothetical protein ACJ8CB_24050 [Ktedonobacteraceae bacterium]